MKLRLAGRRRGRPWTRVALALTVVMTGGPGTWTRAGAADRVSTLEEPMQPITRDSPKIRVCKACSQEEMQDGSSQRMAERAAPEYAAPRDAGPMMMSRDGGASESAVDPYAGTTISVPGAAIITLPVVIQ